jgi:hypothetical protein
MFNPEADAVLEIEFDDVESSADYAEYRHDDNGIYDYD